MGNPNEFVPTQEQKADLKQWIEIDLVTQRQCAERLSVTPKVISRLCRQMKLKTQRTGPRSGSGHPEWKGGRHIDKDGYVLVYAPDHPYRRKHVRYVLEHRLVMENHLGRYLDPREVVHHRNGDKQDNRIENLEVFSENRDHLAETLKGQIPKWTPDGKRRILEAVSATSRRYANIRPRADDGTWLPRTTNHSIVETAT